MESGIDKTIIQSVIRASGILSLFTKEKPKLSLHDIHTMTKMSKTTIARYCNTLCEIGYLERTYEGMTPYYQLGIELFVLGNKVLDSIDLPKLAKKYLLIISKELGDTAYLFVERNGRAYCIDAATGDYFIQSTVVNIGDMIPLNRGGAPVAFLAYLEDTKTKKVIDSLQLSKQEEQKLLKRLDRIKKCGYSFSKEETYLNTAAVGVPIFNHERQVVAAFSVGGIKDRFNEERLPKIVQVLKQAALDLSYELGFREN